MRQLLGEHKTEFIRQSTGINYTNCYTSAKYGHFIAQCWIDERNADKVNYRKPSERALGAIVKPYIRDGQRI